MCVGLLVFSTSKKIAWRVVGRRRSGGGGGTRVANTGSGSTTGSAGTVSVRAGTGGSRGASGADGAGATATGVVVFGARRRRRVRLVVVRSMPASYGTRPVY